MGREEEALAAFREAIRLDGDRLGPAIFDLGRMLGRRGRFDEAAATLRRARRLAEAEGLPDQVELAEREMDELRVLEAIAGARAGSGEAVAILGGMIDRLPDDRQFDSPRSRLITRLVRDDAVFDALTRARPDDPQLWICRGRPLAARGDWSRAATYYAHAIDACPPGEEWYEHAALRLMIGDDHGYRVAVRRIVGATTDDPFLCYVLARSVGVAASPAADPAQVVSQAERAVADRRAGWNLHVWGLVLLRAGRTEEAIHRLEESLGSGWEVDGVGGGENRLALALAHHRLGHASTALGLLDQATAWGRGYEQVIRGRDGTVPATDWLGFSLLLREAEGPIRDAAFPTDPFAP